MKEIQNKAQEQRDPIAVDYTPFRVVDSLSRVCNDQFSGASGVILPRRMNGMNFDTLAQTMALAVARGELTKFVSPEQFNQFARAQTSEIEEMKVIAADMQCLRDIGRKPYLHIAQYDYEDATVARPHVDAVARTQSAASGVFADRILCVYNGRATRHVSVEDTISSYRWDDGVLTYGLGPNAKINRIDNGDLLRFPREGAEDAKPFIHWSPADENYHEPRLVLGA